MKVWFFYKDLIKKCIDNVYYLYRVFDVINNKTINLIKTKIMVTLREQCEVVYVIGILLLFVVSFLWMCVDGLCTPDWLLPNVILSCVGEVLLCYVLVRHIRRGATRLRGSRVKDFYKRIFLLSLLWILFGIVWLLDACGIFKAWSVRSTSGFGFSFNIILIALIFLVWMMIEIHKINKRRKKWLNLKKGYWNRNNLFFES